MSNFSFNILENTENQSETDHEPVFDESAELKTRRKPIEAKLRDYTKTDTGAFLLQYPSYTNFVVPYDSKCYIRYLNSKKTFEKQFQKELNLLVAYQPTAMEAVRFNRHIAYTTLWPPLHNIREIERFPKFFRRSPKDRKRLEFLLNNPQY